jgi:hypothetical protein
VSDAATLNGCVAEEIRLGDRLVHGLAVERILLAEERGRLPQQVVLVGVVVVAGARDHPSLQRREDRIGVGTGGREGATRCAP